MKVEGTSIGPRRGGALRDLLLVAALGLVALVIFTAIDFAEKTESWLPHVEFVEVDEVLPASAVMAVGLAILSVRRRRELAAALSARIRASEEKSLAVAQLETITEAVPGLL